MAARELSTTSYTMASQNIKLTHRMLSTILGYALSIHKLQGNTSDRLSLKVGENEFAARFLLVGCMWTKTFQGRSCLPFPNHEHFLPDVSLRLALSKNTETLRQTKAETNF